MIEGVENDATFIHHIAFGFLTLVVPVALDLEQPIRSVVSGRAEVIIFLYEGCHVGILVPPLLGKACAWTSMTLLLLLAGETDGMRA